LLLLFVGESFIQVRGKEVCRAESGRFSYPKGDVRTGKLKLAG